jgi:hypothetical protein
MMKFWLRRGTKKLELKYVLEIDGIGMMPITPITRASYLQPGVTLERFAVQPRQIALAFGTKYAGEEAWRQFRQELYALLRPTAEEPVVFQVQIGNETYEIDCYYNSELQLQPDPQSRFWQRCVVELLAPDPRWRSSLRSSYYLQAPGGGFAVPLVVPVSIAGDTASELMTIDYEGTVDAEPRILAYGPLDSLLLEHSELGCKIELTNLAMGINDILEIDCRWGHKSVVLNGSNVLDKLAEGSDLVSFRILASSTNNIHIVATGIGASTYVVFQFHKLYAGI